MKTTTIRIARQLGATAPLLVVLAGCGETRTRVLAQEFASPEEAVAALVAAAEKWDVSALKTILGSDGIPLVETKDRVLDRNNATAFAAEARTQQRLDLDSAKTTAVLVVGAKDWPMPIPIVKGDDGRWSFDAESGRNEILLRRIGRNELDAIEVSHGYVEAQRAYALVKHDGAQVNQYAQRVISTPGKRDGLAWVGSDGTWQGPIGEAIAHAIAEGYKSRYEPYHGYHFKVLKGQGPAAPMGEMDFLVNGAMIGGFALVAAPAEYLVTGVKTFMVSHDGIVYQKDLGDQTAEQFGAMERYNPDSTWTPVPPGT